MGTGCATLKRRGGAYLKDNLPLSLTPRPIEAHPVGPHVKFNPRENLLFLVALCSVKVAQFEREGGSLMPKYSNDASGIRETLSEMSLPTNSYPA